MVTDFSAVWKKRNRGILMGMSAFLSAQILSPKNILINVFVHFQ